MMYGVVVLCRCAYEDSQCVEKQVGVLMTTSSQYVNGESLAKWMHKAIYHLVQRFQTYQLQTLPILRKYEGLGLVRRIDATPTPDVV